MRLQIDASVIFAITNGKYNLKRKLLLKDLKFDNPYNTYKYKGLPPGPINNPGYDAILASINPKESDLLYFVADGKGRHIFTKTNRDHNKAKSNLKNNRKRF